MSKAAEKIDRMRQVIADLKDKVETLRGERDTLAADKEYLESINKDLGDENEKLIEICEAVWDCCYDADSFRRKAEYLKGTDGEGWSVGEMLERLIKYIENYEKDEEG